MKLVNEVDQRYPDRSKQSDGSIASAQHTQQNPSSDHEVDAADLLVKALDLTDSPPAFDPDDFAETVRRSRDPRIKYVISDRRMFSSYPARGVAPYTWRDYPGDNPHTSHVHFSVTDEGARDTRTWFPSPDEQDEPVPELAIIEAFSDWLGRPPSDKELAAHVYYAAANGLPKAILNIARSAEAVARRK